MVCFDKQILPILEEDRVFADALFESFDFDSNAWANIELGSHTMFSGEILGPYTVLAKPKGSELDWVFEVTIKTKWTICDAAGNDIPLMDEMGKAIGIFKSEAVRIEETFASIDLKRYKEFVPDQRVKPVQNSQKVPLKETRVIFFVDAAGKVFSDNKEVDINDLSPKIKGSKVMIRVSSTVPHSTVTEIMTKFADEGVTNISFITSDEE